MKGMSFHTNFIAFAALVCLGIPGQARASEGGCGAGQSAAHRKVTTSDSSHGLSGIAVEMYGRGTRQYYDAIAQANPDEVRQSDYMIMASWPGHDVILTVCLPFMPARTVQLRDRAAKPVKSFTAPASIATAALAAAKTATSLPDVEGFAASANAPALPLPDVQLPVVQLDPPQTATAEPAKQQPAPKAATVLTSAANEAHAPPVTSETYAATGKSYAVIITVRPDVVQRYGITAGTFRALLVENQRANQEWSKKRRMTLTFEPGNNGYYIGYLFFNKKPPKNSGVLVDCGNGNELPIAGDLLQHGTPSNQAPPRPFKGKTYVALERSVRIHSSWFLTGLRFAVPTGGPTVMAMAMTGWNPIGLASIPFSIGMNIANHKLADNQRKGEALRNPGLKFGEVLSGVQDDMDALKDHDQRLEDRIRALEQKINTQRSAQTEAAQ